MKRVRHGTDGITELAWMTPNMGDDERHKLKSHDKPAPTFKRALTALEGDFIYTLDLVDKKGSITLTTVAVDYDQNGNRGVVLSGVRKVDAGTYALSTPRMVEPTEDAKSGPNTLTADQVKRVQKVLVEASKFADGNRTPAQTELPLDETEEAEAEAPA